MISFKNSTLEHRSQTSVSSVEIWYWIDIGIAWYSKMEYPYNITNENTVSEVFRNMLLYFPHCLKFLSTKSRHNFSFRHPPWRRWSAAWRPAGAGVKGHLCCRVQLVAVGTFWSHPDTRGRRSFFSRWVSSFRASKGLKCLHCNSD